MTPMIFAGSANVPLTEAGAARLDIRPGSREVAVFRDGEMQVELQESVRGEDIYFVQPTSPPGKKHLLELLLLTDAAHRAGAARLTAVPILRLRPAGPEGQQAGGSGGPTG